MNMIQKRKDDFEIWRKSRVYPAVTRYYLDAYLQNLDQPALLREARAHAALYDHMPPVICPSMELVGLLGYREPVTFNYGGGTSVDEQIAQELTDGDGDIWTDIEKVRVRAYKTANPEIYSEAELRSIESCAATSAWFGGHMVLDFERVLRIGLDGYARDIERARVTNRGREDFYEALTVMLEAIQRLTDRYAAACSGELSCALSHIAHEPPETFHQALQLVWMLHVLNGADSFGRLDYYLDPFYRADIAAGRMDESRAEELICDLVLNIEDAGAIQNMTIGGTDGAGRDFYTPLTKMIIRVTRELGYKGPNLCLRVTSTMPEDIWEEAIATIASGIGLPALYNDGLYVASLVRHDVPLELARGYCLAGCSQLNTTTNAKNMIY